MKKCHEHVQLKKNAGGMLKMKLTLTFEGEEKIKNVVDAAELFADGCVHELVNSLFWDNLESLVKKEKEGML